MNTINYKFYLNYTDYDSNNKRRQTALETYQTTKEDLIRCAYTVGLSANLVKLLPDEIKLYRGTIIDAYLDFTNTQVQLKEGNLRFLEQSEKNFFNV